MKTLAQQSNKIVMWYKVKELSSKGLNKSQISVELGIDRGTVRHYLLMDEQSFHDWVSKPQYRPVKLKEYTNYVKNTLEEHPYLSSAQVEDWLKENYSDLPEVHSKTVYNFVEQICKGYNIPKSDLKTNREYEKLPERDYGIEAQVDFGSFNMIAKDKCRQKVHFFVMVLSRSRQKYVYFQITPFTSKTTVDAHNLAFRYFGGQPKKIVYDQDRVLLISENLGDFYLTKEFQTYSSQM